MKAKANDSTRKISPLNCFVLGKNKHPSSNIQGNINMSYNFWNGFLTKCFETQTLWNFERPTITTAPAWRPSFLYRLDCQGDANNKHIFPATASQSTPR
jgi:hypothetical protein